MKIFISGSNGMVGHSLMSLLRPSQHQILAPQRAELNLLDKAAVKQYLEQHRPELIIHLAARVGGIQANINSPVEFLVENTQMAINLMTVAAQLNIEKFINIGSSCMYPKGREILHESDLLTGILEPTNEGYAIAKISASLLCDYISRQYGFQYKTIIPCNLYGPFDNFDLTASHLIPAVIRKLANAIEKNLPSVEIWGDGMARREFMYADDLTQFILLAIDQLERLEPRTNVGLGFDYTIKDYYHAAAEFLGYQGGFTYDLSKPAGMHRKLLNVEKAHALGWRAKISLAEGIAKTYEYFKQHYAAAV